MFAKARLNGDSRATLSICLQYLLLKVKMMILWWKEMTKIMLTNFCEISIVTAQVVDTNTDGLL